MRELHWTNGRTQRRGSFSFDMRYGCTVTLIGLPFSVQPIAAHCWRGRDGKILKNTILFLNLLMELKRKLCKTNVEIPLASLRAVDWSVVQYAVESDAHAHWPRQALPCN